ncbi:hypothetical protein [Niallia taxi]|uniref:hypothetical protein n=1 Tax=Niallia taxi TaxID=2499688 RepID=UPI0015F387C1|nr:hypothetical protein [Niallia taxi]
MGMGYGCNFGMIISREEVLKVAPNEFKALEEKLEELEVSLDTLAQAVHYSELISDEDVTDEEAETLDSLWEKVTEAFEKQTGIGLLLSYHSKSDEGDRYDEVDGAYFELSWNDVYKLSPEAQKLKENLGVNFGLKGWVTYG